VHFLFCCGAAFGLLHDFLAVGDVDAVRQRVEVAEIFATQ
jgi:hypothetical protein